MKISHIIIKNFLGLSVFDTDLAPLTLISGPNGSGKTSVRDAIAYSLTGDLPRIKIKKDARQLITIGANKAQVKTQTDHGLFAVTINKSNVNNTSALAEMQPGLMECMDMHRFSRMSPNDRQALLFDLSGLSTSAPDIRKRLGARNCDVVRAERIIPLLRSGFSSAESEAKAIAREGKAAWRAITGQTWGVVVADEWTPDVPDAPDIDVSLLETELNSVTKNVKDARDAIGRRQQQNQQHEQQKQRIDHLRTIAQKHEGLSKEVGQARENATLAQEESNKATAELKAAKDNRKVQVFPCPYCDGLQTYDGEKMTAYKKKEHTQETLPAQVVELQSKANTLNLKASQAQNKLKLLQTQQASDNTYISVLRELEPNLLAKVDESEISIISTEINRLTQEENRLRKEIAQAIDVQRQRNEATKKQESANQQHNDVLAWLWIADALSSKGIPADLLHDATAPFNNALAEHSTDTGWDLVRITENMEILYGLLPYSLCSESEQWRADAMITAALTELSGIGLVVLDRFDVLDIPSRGQTLRWLHAMRGRIQSVLLGTLKTAPPAREGMAVCWLER